MERLVVGPRIALPMSAIWGKADVRELPAVCLLISRTGHTSIVTCSRLHVAGRILHRFGAKEQRRVYKQHTNYVRLAGDIRMSAIGGKADVRELPAVCPLIARSGHSTYGGEKSLEHPLELAESLLPGRE